MRLDDLLLDDTIEFYDVKTDWEDFISLQNYVIPKTQSVIIYFKRTDSYKPLYDFHGGEFNLKPMIGDYCRMSLKGYGNATMDSNDTITMFFLWEGFVTEGVIDSTNVLFGVAYVKTVLIEKAVNKKSTAHNLPWIFKTFHD